MTTTTNELQCPSCGQFRRHRAGCPEVPRRAPRKPQEEARARVLEVNGQPIEVEDVAQHRNGDGKDFSVVTFRHRGRRMVGIVFDAPGHVAVFERVMLGAGMIERGQNSWLGDAFEPALRRAIRRQR